MPMQVNGRKAILGRRWRRRFDAGNDAVVNTSACYCQAAVWFFSRVPYAGVCLESVVDRVCVCAECAAIVRQCSCWTDRRACVVRVRTLMLYGAWIVVVVLAWIDEGQSVVQVAWCGNAR